MRNDKSKLMLAMTAYWSTAEQIAEKAQMKVKDVRSALRSMCEAGEARSLDSDDGIKYSLIAHSSVEARIISEARKRAEKMASDLRQLIAEAIGDALGRGGLDYKTENLLGELMSYVEEELTDLNIEKVIGQEVIGQEMDSKPHRKRGAVARDT
jgi:hypothetical protein